MNMSHRWHVNSAHDRSTFNALLVDDNISFRQVLSDILYAYFPLIGIEEAGDWAEVQSKVDYLHPNIIFMDIQLPGVNGLELTKEIKQVYSDIVIVVLSTNDLPEYRQQAFRNGADCYISKTDDSCLQKILRRVAEAMAVFLRNR